MKKLARSALEGLAWAAIGGLSVWGVVERHVAEAWAASWQGVVVMTVVAFLVGFRVGTWVAEYVVNRDRRRVWRMLSERELWCLSHVWHRFPSKFSVGVNGPLTPSFDVLADAGILMFHGEENLRGERVRVYTPRLEWRAWISDHADELPEPDDKAPGMRGTEVS